MAYSKARAPLTPLQQDVLDELFATEQGFFLTGGAALAGFHLHHRGTTDLDLFTLDDAVFERSTYVLAALSAKLDATLKSEISAPRFRRYVVSRPEESVVVDCVRESVFQLDEQKLVVDGVRIDPAEEILANKLTAIVGRMEERDLVDVLALEKAGLKVEAALAAAQKKDASCTPATLAWLLSEVVIPANATLPGGVSGVELSHYLQGLVARLRQLAFPR